MSPERTAGFRPITCAGAAGVVVLWLIGAVLMRAVVVNYAVIDAPVLDSTRVVGGCSSMAMLGYAANWWAVGLAVTALVVAAAAWVSEARSTTVSFWLAPILTAGWGFLVIAFVWVIGSSPGLIRPLGAGGASRCHLHNDPSDVAIVAGVYVAGALFAAALVQAGALSWHRSRSERRDPG